MKIQERGHSLLDKPVKSSSLVDQLVDRLETAIITGELKGGARLSEQALATSMGVSRSPLREALRRLEGRRLIERVPNIGARVTLLLRQDLEEILVIREVLEALACRLATAHLTDSDLVELERLLERHEIRKSSRSPALYDKSADHDFHVRIIMASSNQKLIDILCGDLYYLMRVHRYRSSTTPERARKAPLEHRAVLAAFKSRDPDAAESAMREHLSHAHANMLHKDDDSKDDNSAGLEASQPLVAIQKIKRKISAI